MEDGKKKYCNIDAREWDSKYREAIATNKKIISEYQKQVQKEIEAAKPAYAISSNEEAEVARRRVFLTKSELLARHKSKSQELGTVTSTTVDDGNGLPVPPIKMDHYSSNMRVGRTDEGQIIIKEPMATSRLHGGEVPQINTFIKDGLPESMVYELPSKVGKVAIGEIDGTMYIYYPSGAIMQFTKPNACGMQMFYDMAWRRDTQPFKISNYIFVESDSKGYAKLGDMVLTLFPKYSTSYGWSRSAYRGTMFGVDYTNGDLYEIDRETADYAKVGKMAGDKLVRIPDGFEFKSIANGRVDFEGGSYMTFNDGKPDMSDIYLKSDSYIIESGGKMIFELDGQEVETRGEIDIPWSENDNPLSCIKFARIYDMNGAELDIVRNGKSDKHALAEKHAAEKEEKAVLERKMAQLRQKYGTTMANKALDGNLTVGMPLALVNELPEWFVLHLETQSGSKKYYTVYKYAYTSVGKISQKYAYIRVENGKIEYIDLY